VQEKFEEFWEAYPKKSGRRAAFEEFEMYGLKWDAIIDGARRYAESTIVDGEERWIKSPANFIKDQTWRQRFKPGIEAQRRARAAVQAQQQQNTENEVRELPPKCKHNPTVSVLKCELCRDEWLATTE
jgi:hypothetical protein